MDLRSVKCVLLVVLNFVGVLHAQQILNVKYQTKYFDDTFPSELKYKVDTKKSLFINYTKEIDPKTAKISEKNQIGGVFTDYKEEFVKDFNENVVYSNSNISYVKKTVVKENLEFDWKIDYTVFKTILNYKCYMAKTFFKGRDYTVYFTTEINIPDGPRKFANLPGLILEVSEDSGILKIIAKDLQYIDDQPYFNLDIKNAISWNDAIIKAKVIFNESRNEIENKYNSRVKTDFSNHLEKFDLNN
ncbi:GLPGLI family protein [Frigoriflavimonas asaccharolytica]|uniref:GLPGLI family protein n=1 Tax=Frigoriflavimonas asaccharolytica TaxID=2735899 RepID=A0A8J8GCC0_9FLAO|nr:GLPGLI family protein [Frigoriflavimonas asaccharolytica]NRS93614.1 GLPGLI family protein [Frigoriflavimonas asaccharolytica]